MQINYSRLAYNCYLSGVGINLTEYFDGTNNVMLYGDFKTIKIIKINFEKNTFNNERLAVNYPFEYMETKHNYKVVPDYESTGKNIKKACLKLGLKEKYGY